MTVPDDPKLKPPCHYDDAVGVLAALRQAGHVAYFAGGCVRDTLLGLTPKDYDVATDAPPSKVRKLFANTQAVGAAFGVILVRMGQSVVEVATFRNDGAYRDGRRPDSVRFTTAQEDAQRRDFTINGLFLDPVANQVIDYIGGQDDLKNHCLRAIGNARARFAEDHLRLLRAVRFASRFGFTIEAQTAAAIVENAPRLKGISPERIGDELRHMLPPPTRTDAWKLLWQFGLARELFRFLPIRPDQTMRFDGSIFISLCPSEPVPFALALAAAALDTLRQSVPSADPDYHDIRPWLSRQSVNTQVHALRQALRISNDESDVFSTALSGLEPLLADTPPSLATKLRYLGQPTVELSRQLLQALQSAGLHTARIGELFTAFTRLGTWPINPLPLITGDDLTAAGLQPGPKFKRILDTVYDAQLERRIATNEQALAMALAMNAGE